MNIKITRYIPSVLAFLLAIFAAFVLCMYITPMENISLDLSLISNEDSLDYDPADFDSKGWTVYTKETDTVTELTPNGFGGYTGLELGQTFYFSRVMAEELDRPTLQLHPIEYRFSVWLDDTLIYTDCPELDNRIGYVSLPMNEWYREDPIVISLPSDYQGKTLTIAQSFPEWSETGSVTAWPANLTLYCGYAYESGLISETFQTAVLACVAFLIVVVLLIAFVRSGNWSLLCMALVAALWMAEELIRTSFFTEYFGSFENSPTAVLSDLSALALLIFLALRGGKHRKLLWLPVGLCAINLARTIWILTVYPVFSSENILLDFLVYGASDWLLFAALAAVLVLGIVFWRRKNRFYRIFVPMAFVSLAIAWVGNILANGSDVWEQIVITLSNRQIKYIFSICHQAVTVAALVTTIAQSVKDELDRRAEQQMMEQRRELALESYENLHRQHEEVMMIRHDILRHFRTLHDMDGEERRTAYLAELIGQNEKVRPVVDSGNEMLDIILNGRLSAAIDAGIRVELPHIAAPEKLPLSDPDLCAMFLNLVDNAITAASAAEDSFLRLKLHHKDGHLALVCENSFDPQKTEIEAIKETVPKHGLGLKIVCHIVEKYKGTILTDSNHDQFSVKIVIPMDTL